MKFKGGSEADYIKWAEEELAKIKISEQDQVRAFSDMIMYDLNKWVISPDGKCKYIRPDMPITIQEGEYTTLEEILSDLNQVDDRIYKDHAADIALEKVLDKLQNSIGMGKYIQDGTV